MSASNTVPSGTILEIPLSGVPETFTITLGGVTYNFSLQYRDVGLACWWLDIADINQNPLVNGIPLVTGADLFAQYAYLGFTGKLIVYTDGTPNVVPTYDGLGTTSHLLWVAP